MATTKQRIGRGAAKKGGAPAMKAGAGAGLKPGAAKAGRPTAPKPAAVTPVAKGLDDAAGKARFRDELARLKRARSGEMAGWDETYEAVGEILLADPPLYLFGGYDSARAFLAAHLPGVSERSVATYVRVAKYFEAEDEAKYGISKLAMLLDYIEATGGAKLIPAKIAPERIKVRLPAPGGGTGTRPFPELSFDQLRAAVKAAQPDRRPGRVKEAPIVVALRQALAKAKLRGVSVRLRDKKIDLGGIEPERLDELGRALVGAKLPA